MVVSFPGADQSRRRTIQSASPKTAAIESSTRVDVCTLANDNCWYPACCTCDNSSCQTFLVQGVCVEKIRISQRLVAGQVGQHLPLIRLCLDVEAKS